MDTYLGRPWQIIRSMVLNIRSIRGGGGGRGLMFQYFEYMCLRMTKLQTKSLNPVAAIIMVSKWNEENLSYFRKRTKKTKLSKGC